MPSGLNSGRKRELDDLQYSHVEESWTYVVMQMVMVLKHENSNINDDDYCA